MPGKDVTAMNRVILKCNTSPELVQISLPECKKPDENELEYQVNEKQENSI